jgi:hypothetical protein
VNSSRVLSFLALAIAIMVTVPLKLNDFTADQQRLRHNLQQATAALLAREGYEIEIGTRFGFFVIKAQKKDCRLQIRETATEGFNADLIKADVPKDARLVFAYRGKLWTNHPTFRATISELWMRLQWRLGFNSSWSPVISITALGPCAIETLPWDELATIQAN